MDDSMWLDIQETVEIPAEIGPVQQQAPSVHPLTEVLASRTAIAAVIGKVPALAQPALQCLLGAKAATTTRAYTSVINKFSAFCATNNLPFPLFTTEAVVQYLLQMVADGAAFNALASLRPALSYLEQAAGRDTVFTPDAVLLLEGAKRRAKAKSQPVKKAPALLPEELARAIALAFPPGNAHGHADAVLVRTAFRILIVYHTLCRLSCFRLLKAKHFEKVGPDIVITFPAAKNDQFHKGQQSVLPASGGDFCSVHICEIFFRRFHLRFGAQEADDSFLLFQLRKSGGELLPIGSRCLAASTATSDLRRLLAAVGIHRPVTDKSVKMSGVTAAFAAGATTTEVMHIGRWRSPNIPLHYKHNSFAFKKAVASKVPAITL